MSGSLAFSASASRSERTECLRSRAGARTYCILLSIPIVFIRTSFCISRIISDVFRLQHLPADQEALFIRYGFIFFCDGVFASNDQIVAYIAVSASAAADQCPMDLTDSEEVAVAQERKYMEKPVLLSKLCVGALCEAVACRMMLFVVGSIDIINLATKYFL